ncbi:adenosine deaminase [Oricola sp.]|uniref:adenosine deaminase n=1 Tax=Oricola sp. TaxID=1979950 RepID=UPI0025EDEFAB|nr:adenosine deaminase [Oricola sp.]MCI5077683.1 adenosine deaminase [Oricola sp.]
MVAKAEIHCHIEGAAGPALVRTQAEKYGADISVIIRDDAYVWSDFTTFLQCYDIASRLFRSQEDYALLAETYLRDLAAQGAIYSEFFISTDHAISAGLTPEAYVDGLAEGMLRARAATGIEARMIATGLRHEGPQGVERAARWIADHPHPLVTGFGMAGDERMHEPKDFARAFDIARDAGLAITVHAGELCGADSVRGALDHLRPSRIGHGVRAIEDPALVERLARDEIVLEVCPGSNIALGVFASYDAHPLPRLRDAGVRVTLSSDDPPFFHTSLAQEYETARRHFGMDDAALLDMTRTSIEAAFVDEETRDTLLARLG